MSEDDGGGRPGVPFSRPMPVRRLSRKRETPVSIAAEAEELDALARFLGVDRVDRLSLEGTIAPSGEEGWELRGRLVAALEQTCVVSLAPVAAHHDAEIERLYLPADRLPPVREVTVTPDEADEPDPFDHSIDPAALAVENLVLMLDPYPRAEDAALERATFAAPGVTPLEDEDVRPLAGLAALRRELSKDGE